MNLVPYYRKILKDAFEQRLEHNPRYSVRAFAASLKIDSSVCSQLLSGKRVPSVTVARRRMDRLSLDAQEREAFLQSLGKEKVQQGLKRVNPNLRNLANYDRDVPIHTWRALSVDAFQTVARWYYYAILELVKLPTFQDSPKWIARELGIGEPEAKFAVERLLELQMLERVEGKLVKTYQSFYTADPHLTTTAHRRTQREILNKSINQCTGKRSDFRT